MIQIAGVVILALVFAVGVWYILTNIRFRSNTFVERDGKIVEIDINGNEVKNSEE